MEYLQVTESELDDIIAVFRERGIELLYSIQDGECRIYSHIEAAEDILWAARLVDELVPILQGADLCQICAGIGL